MSGVRLYKTRLNLGHLFLIGLSLGCFVALTGCGRGGPKLGKVVGKVTLDGKVVQGAVVEFAPADGSGSPSYGVTDEDGCYKAEFSQTYSGVLLGKHTVRITSDDPVYVGGDNKGSVEVFPPKYHSESEVTVDVVKGKNEFDFDCESGGYKVAAVEGF